MLPEAIGGRLWAPFLCKDCNSKSGVIEEKLLGDIVVVNSARAILSQLPRKLALNIYSRTRYFRDDKEHGRLYAKPRRDDGELELRTTNAGTRRDEDVRKEIEMKLRSAGLPAEHIQDQLAAYAAAAPGSAFEFLPGETIQKPIDASGLPFQRTYDEPLVPTVVPLGIAYLFLACCIGDAIYNDVFQPARDALSRAFDGDEEASDGWQIEHLANADRITEPMLGLAYEEYRGEAVVRVVIFRWLVWRVHFPRAPAPAARLHYARFLDIGEEDTNLSDAR